MVCEICKKSLPQDGEYVNCRKCTLDFHFHCAGVQKSTWKVKSMKKKSEWECVNCRPSATKTRNLSADLEEENEEDDPIYINLKKMLAKMFKKQEENITARVESIVQHVEKLHDTINNLLDRVREVEENASELRKEVEELKIQFECEKQYERSKNFIVTSLPHAEKEDVSEKITMLLQTMDINLKKEDITAHRLPSKNSPAPIIVQCTTRAIRDNIVRNARKLRPKTSLISDDQPERAIFFNDHLTPYFSNLMKMAREVKEQKGFKYIWLNGNKIMLKKDNMSKAFRILKPEDLGKIV